MKHTIKLVAGIARNAFSAVVRRVHIALGVAQSTAAGITRKAMNATGFARLVTRAATGRRVGMAFVVVCCLFSAPAMASGWAHKGAVGLSCVAVGGLLGLSAGATCLRVWPGLSEQIGGALGSAAYEWVHGV